MNLVVKIGGASGIGGSRLLDDLANQAECHPGIVLVHGGSDATTQLQHSLGQEAEFLESPGGHTSRRTSRLDLEAFAMATGLVNRELVEGLLARGVNAFGCSGLDGGMVRGARKSATRVVENGRVRVVRDQWTGRPERLALDPLRALVAAGCVPVVAPVQAGDRGEMLNTDGDRLAACIAAGLSAETLVILTNVPGLLEDPECEESLIEFVPLDELERFGRYARGRMAKKLLGAREALAGGVRRVILADARREAPLRDALRGIGTVIGEALEEQTAVVR